MCVFSLETALFAHVTNYIIEKEKTIRNAYDATVKGRKKRKQRKNKSEGASIAEVKCNFMIYTLSNVKSRCNYLDWKTKYITETGRDDIILLNP